MSKKVILSKTFVNEAEFQHFKKQYDANTTAFENIWNLEVVELDTCAASPQAPAEAQVEAPAATEEAPVANAPEDQPVTDAAPSETPVEAPAAE